MKITPGWIVGFVDGDGHFGITTTSQNKMRCCFVVSQDKASADVLYAIKNFFKCGSVHKAGGNMLEYKVTSNNHLKQIIIPFFLKNSLITSKQQNFVRMAHACLDHDLDSDLIQCVVKTQPSEILTQQWLLGFIDAEGCFVCDCQNSKFMPQMIIGLNCKDKMVLDLIKNFLGYGIRYNRKNGTEIFQLSSQKACYDFVKTYLLTAGSKDRLRTHKRISARKWSKLVVFLFETPKQITNSVNKQSSFEKAQRLYALFKASKKNVDLVSQD